MKTIRLFAAFIAMSCSSLVFAQAMGMGMGAPLPAFADVDKDGNGMISKEELGAIIPARGVERIFGNLDKDENGSLTEEEYSARRQGRQQN